jgi:CHAD domain-containing protein
MNISQELPLLFNSRFALIKHARSIIRTLRPRELNDEQVHETRKEMKKVRAGLRLLRGALGKRNYHHLNQLVRDAAQPFTSARDAKILCEALDELASRAEISPNNAGMIMVRRILQQELQIGLGSLSESVLIEVTSKLRKVERELQNLPEASIKAGLADSALKRARRKARKTFAIAKREPSNENLHEWRKQVKYHFNQLEFMQPIKPKRIGAIINRAHKLADFLGDDHDLALLQEKLTSPEQGINPSWDSKDGRSFMRTLTHRRAKLQHKAQRIGRKLYG